MEPQTPPYHSKKTYMLLNIVGTRYYTEASKLTDYLSQAPSHTMMLVPDPYNPYDSEAIAVLDCDSQNRRIAYVSRADLPKLHRLMRKIHASVLKISVIGQAPGCQTTLQAFPIVNGQILKFVSSDDSDDDVTENFTLMENELKTMSHERKERLYKDMCYLRDICKCHIRQSTLTAFRQSIERDNACSLNTTKIDQFINNNPGKVTHG